MEQVIKDVTAAIKDDMYITSAAIPCEIVENDIDNILRDFKGIKEFIDCSFGSPEEDNMKKLFAKAMVMAQEQGVLPTVLSDFPKDPVAIASLVDESLTRIKTAVMVEAGDIFPENAVNAVIDRSIVRVNVVADAFIAKGVNMVAAKAVSIMAWVFPPTQAIAPVIHIFAHFCTFQIKNKIREGLRKVATTAKNVVKKIGTFAIKTVQKIGRSILNFFGL
jgi:hypothetical protein